MQGCLGGGEGGRGGEWPVNDRLQLSIIMMGWKGGMIFLDLQTEGKQDQSNYWFCDAQMNIVLDPMFMIKLTVFLL